MSEKVVFYIVAIVGGIGALLLVILLPMSFAGVEYYEVSSSVSVCPFSCLPAQLFL